MKRFEFALRYSFLVASLAAAVSGSAVGAFAHDSSGMGGGAGGGGGSTVSSSADQINPQARTYFNQGAAYSKEKKWFLAIAAYTQAARLEPEYAAAWNNLGHSYRKAQQYSIDP